MSQAQQESILRRKQETFTEFIWNSKLGTFMGRTQTSWIKIAVFYVIFYSFLAGFFQLSDACLLQSSRHDLHAKVHSWNRDSILRNPALGFRPMPRENSTLIWYNTGSYDSIAYWVNSLSNFVDKYRFNEREENGSNVKDCTDENPATSGEVCRFSIYALGSHCSRAESFGYTRKSPCVLLEMNKMIGWVPEVYDKHDIDNDLLPQNMPEDLRERIMQSASDNGGHPDRMVWVSCEGKNGADREYIGELEYTPWQGFPAYFYPYLNTSGYMAPLIAVRFRHPSPNIIINIQCKAWAKNIWHAKKERLGVVNFELLRD